MARVNSVNDEVFVALKLKKAHFNSLRSLYKEHRYTKTHEELRSLIHGHAIEKNMPVRSVTLGIDELGPVLQIHTGSTCYEWMLPETVTQ